MSAGETRAPLPPGWVWSTIAELIGNSGLFSDGDWVESKDQDPMGEVRLLQLADIGDGCFLDRSSRFMTSERAGALNCTELKPGDVLISRMADPIARACVFPGAERPCVTVVDAAIVRPGANGPDANWLMNAVNAPDYRSAAAAAASGTTRSRVSRSNLGALPLPVPPLAEQRRIVAKLDAVMARSRAARAALEAVPALLEQYRRAVLAAAFRGELTADWRAAHPEVEPASALLARIRDERRRRWEEAELARLTARGKPPRDDRWKAEYEESSAPDLPTPIDVPAGWLLVSLEAVCDVVGGLTKGPVKPGAEHRRNVPYLRVANVQRGHLILDEVLSIPAAEADIRRLRLIPGDILMNEGGDRDKLGRGWVWEGQIDECIHQNHVFRARPIGRLISSKFVSFFTNSLATSFFMSAGKQSTNLASVSLSRIRRCPVLLPPLAEQHEVVRRVEAALARVARVKAAVETQRQQLDALDRAVLDKAFRGELVPQHPDDEPAALMLARIQAERAATGAPRRARRGRGRGDGA